MFRKIIVFLTVFMLTVSCVFSASAVSFSGSYNRLYWFDWSYSTSSSDGSVTYTVSLPVDHVCISVFDADLNCIDYCFANGGSADIPSYGSIQISFFDTAWSYDADDSLPWYARFEPSGGQYLWFSRIPADTELEFSVFVKKVGFKYNNSYFGAYYTKSTDYNNPSFTRASKGSTAFNAFSDDEFEITCKTYIDEDATGAAFSLFLTELTQGNWEISINAITLSFKVSSSVSDDIKDDISSSINGAQNDRKDEISGALDDAANGLVTPKPDIGSINVNVVPDAGLNSINSVLSVITSDINFLSVMVMSATLMMVSYIFFGKKG